MQNPVAYEWMIDLCNRTGKDMWITVPHVADDDYVKKPRQTDPPNPGSEAQVLRRMVQRDLERQFHPVGLRQ